MGVLYLVLSSSWKRFKDRRLVYAAHGTAIFFSLLSFIIREPFLLLLLQTALLLLVVILTFMGKQKFSQTKLIYLLVAVLWLINIWIIGNRRPAPLAIELVFYAISLAVFFVVYYKVSKWTK
jgi:hypothetical protein